MELRSCPDLAPTVVIASNFGQDHYPGWYYNLKAHPETTVRVGRSDVEVRAREVTGDERAEVWQLLTAQDERCEQYQSRTERLFPIMVLDPR